MKKFCHKMSPRYGLFFVVIGVIGLITNHLLTSAYSNYVSLLSFVAVVVGIVVYVAAYKASERY